MISFKRAFFRCQTDAASNLTVDLLIDDRRRWMEKVPTAGWWGTVRSNNIWPFILYEDGKIDFGNTAEDPSANDDRFGWLSISNQILVQGERYQFAHHGHYTMILEKLTDISELPGID